MKNHIFIIEHLEPRMWRWCVIEYEHISQIIGKHNVWFTSIKRGSKKLRRFGKVLKHSVKELNIDLTKVCVLDPEAPQTLNPRETKRFGYFIFGGILGDYPPKKRTKKELTQFIPNAETRNIGKKQLSTDNAVYIVHEIINGKNLSQIPFKNKIEIRINEIESTILSFRYPLVNGKPYTSSKIITYLKRKKDF